MQRLGELHLRIWGLLSLAFKLLDPGFLCFAALINSCAQVCRHLQGGRLCGTAVHSKQQSGTLCADYTKLALCRSAGSSPRP